MAILKVSYDSTKTKSNGLLEVVAQLPKDLDLLIEITNVSVSLVGHATSIAEAMVILWEYNDEVLCFITKV